MTNDQWSENVGELHLSSLQLCTDREHPVIQAVTQVVVE